MKSYIHIRLKNITKELIKWSQQHLTFASVWVSFRYCISNRLLISATLPITRPPCKWAVNDTSIGLGFWTDVPGSSKISCDVKYSSDGPYLGRKTSGILTDSLPLTAGSNSVTCDKWIVMVAWDGMVATVQEKMWRMLSICCDTAAVWPCITDSL